MAWWQRQRGLFVYVYYRAGGRVTSLPRAKTRHLDSLNDTAVDIWVCDWKRKHGRLVGPQSHVAKYVERYCAFLRSIGRSPKTIWEHKHSLTEFVLPFFLKKRPVLENPNQWPSRSLRFSEYMIGARRQSDSSCRKAVTALRGFYRFLEEEGVVYAGTPIRLRCAPRVQLPTPLRRTISAEEVLDFAKSAGEECALIAVKGYFFSLRTFEVMALRPADFVAGSAARELECCKVMARFGLSDRLAVRIHRQRVGDGSVKEPKRASFGNVACFNGKAAEWLVKRLNARSRLDLLFPLLPDSNIARWSKWGIKGVTMKDLRRASLYHLGHYAGVELISLKGHARHRFATTTELYLRRPIEEPQPGGQLLSLGS